MKIFTVVICSVMLIAAFALAENVQNNGESMMTINGGSRGEVPFPHEKHQQVLGDCNHCHNIFPQEAGAIEKLNADGTLSSKQVMNQCKGCHKTLKDAGKTTGPTKCGDCHIRKD
ncbi:MAG: cytochrome c family protein [Desulfobacterales bacterium]|nr:cytochrome c family protein [Desulfobacterales bacterium]